MTDFKIHVDGPEIVFTIMDAERNCSVSFHMDYALYGDAVFSGSRAKLVEDANRNLEHCLEVHLHSVLDNANNTTP